MNKLFIGDNKKYLQNKDFFNEKFKIVYMDPPYNTGNTFSYNDKISQKTWNKERTEKIKLIKQYMGKNSVFIASISEESVFELHNILKENFKYVFAPFVWLTKPITNQNKVTNIASICHEYILVASDYEINSKLETINIDNNMDDEIIQKKLKRYKTSINLKKDLEEYETIIVNNKEIVVIPKDEYEIKNDFNTGFKNHRFQKRTAQKGHGAQRYVDLTKEIETWNEDTLFFIKGVKDKYDLNGKFIINNSYFQSISSEIKMKIPSFLGFYNSGMENFQTAKPINLLKRVFNVFADKNDFVLDLYGGSGNGAKAANELDMYFSTFEIGTLDEIKNKTNGEFIKNNLKNIENIKIIDEYND